MLVYTPPDAWTEGGRLGWLDCYARVKRAAPLTGEHDSLAAEKSLSAAHTTQRRIDALRITIPPLLAALRDTEPAETTEKTRWSARPGLQALSGVTYSFADLPNTFAGPDNQQRSERMPEAVRVTVCHVAQHAPLSRPSLDHLPSLGPHPSARPRRAARPFSTGRRRGRPRAC